MIFKMAWNAPYHTINDHHNALALQSDCAKLRQWADYWKMDFNPSKCYKMPVHREKSFNKCVIHSV